MGRRDYAALPDLGYACVNKRLYVGLTGGIGSGKSAASGCFADLGAVVVDADVVAHELVEPGMPALAEIVQTFGKPVLDHDLRLDRSALRAIVFADDDKRARLEAILHPRIFPEMLQRADASDAAYVVFCIPLLVESGHRARFGRIVVVDCPEDLQIQRVMERDNLTAEQARAIMRTQATRDQRLAQADDVIHNDRDFEFLEQQIRELHSQYLQFSKLLRA